MKRFVIAWMILAALSLLAGGCSNVPQDYAPQKGDMVFQSLPHGAMVDMIEGSTGSHYSHCGIVVEKNGAWYVLEAIGPVQEISLDAWIGHGRGNAFAVYRLKPPYRSAIEPMITAARRYMGRPYDVHYQMDDERIYCSELLYEGYLQATNTPLGKMEKVSELNWKPYEELMKGIEGGPVPLERKLITPRAITEAPEVELVYKRGY